MHLVLDYVEVFSGVGVRVDFCSGYVYRVLFDLLGILYADVAVLMFVFVAVYSVCFLSGICLRLF